MAEQQITEEELRNMTPEQIAELQKQNCIFCHIVSGKVSSKKVYEDEQCIAILDINPANPGHVLLLPKEHYAVMPQMPDPIIGHLFMVAKGISHACLRAFKAEGTNIFVANGVSAGQRAQHFMIHVIPRKQNDGLNIFTIPHKEASPDQIEQVRKTLQDFVNKSLGAQNIQPVEVQETPKIPDIDEREKEEEKVIAEIQGSEEKEEETVSEEIQKEPESEEQKEETVSEEKESEQKEEDQEESEEDEKNKGVDLDKIAEMFG